MTSKPARGSVGARFSESMPTVTFTNPTSLPKICRSDHDVSLSAGTRSSVRMAIFGVSSSWVVGGFAPTPGSKKRPAVSPTAWSAAAALASKITAPAGIGTPDALEVVHRGHGRRGRSERGAGRNLDRVGTPQVAVAPRSGRGVELGDPVGDVLPGTQRGEGDPSERLVEPHHVRAGREGLAVPRDVGRRPMHLD